MPGSAAEANRGHLMDGDRSILAVIPSIGAPGLENVLQLVTDLDKVSSGATLIPSNSGRLTQELVARKIPYVSDGNNGGFGDSIRKAAEASEEWNWLLIVNDDMSVDAAAFSEAVATALQRSDDGLSIVYFDVDRPRPIPTETDVFLQVSLLNRFVRRTVDDLAKESETYRSFSCVAISRMLYDKVQGFDTSLPFTYEDADFVR